MRQDLQNHSENTAADVPLAMNTESLILELERRVLTRCLVIVLSPTTDVQRGFSVSLLKIVSDSRVPGLVIVFTLFLRLLAFLD